MLVLTIVLELTSFGFFSQFFSDGVRCLLHPTFLSVISETSTFSADLVRTDFRVTFASSLHS